MIKKISMVAMALAMASLGNESLYDYGGRKHHNDEIKPYSTDGKKCGQCTKFKTSRCRLTCNTENSPACSVITIKW